MPQSTVGLLSTARRPKRETVNKPEEPQWTIAARDETGEALTADDVAAEHADDCLVAEVEITAALITYMVTVGRAREAAGLLTDSDRQQLREIEKQAQTLIEVLRDLAILGPSEIVFDGGEYEQ